MNSFYTGGKMTDISVFVPWTAPVIAVVVSFLQMQKAQETEEKAVGVRGEKTTSVAFEKGYQAWEFLHIHLTVCKDTKAQEALAQVEYDLENEEYQQKLVKEIARLASGDDSFAQDLKKLADRIQVAQAGNVTIENLKSNYGAQGTFYAPVHFDHRRMKSDE